MYSGAYDGSRFSPLDQINRTNVQQLALQWVFQTGVRGSHETTPLVIDGALYMTTPQNHAYAIDVRTGRPLWHYERNLPKEMSLAADRRIVGWPRLATVCSSARSTPTSLRWTRRLAACAGMLPPRTRTKVTASPARRWW